MQVNSKPSHGSRGFSHFCSCFLLYEFTWGSTLLTAPQALSHAASAQGRQRWCRRPSPPWTDQGPKAATAALMVRAAHARNSGRPSHRGECASQFAHAVGSTPTCRLIYTRYLSHQCTLAKGLHIGSNKQGSVCSCGKRAPHYLSYCKVLFVRIPYATHAGM